MDELCFWQIFLCYCYGFCFIRTQIHFFIWAVTVTQFIAFQLLDNSNWNYCPFFISLWFHWDRYFCALFLTRWLFWWPWISVLLARLLPTDMCVHTIHTRQSRPQQWNSGNLLNWCEEWVHSRSRRQMKTKKNLNKNEWWRRRTFAGKRVSLKWIKSSIRMKSTTMISIQLKSMLIEAIESISQFQRFIIIFNELIMKI